MGKQKKYLVSILIAVVDVLLFCCVTLAQIPVIQNNTRLYVLKV